MKSVSISTRGDIVWSLAWWAIALVVAIVAFFVASFFIPNDPAAGLVFGGVAFIVVGALMVRFGPGPGPNAEVWHDPDAPALPHAHSARAPAAAPMPEAARVPEPVVAPMPVAPVAPVVPVAPAAVPDAATAETEMPPPGTGISERVRDAARAAGEAARALSGDAGAAVGSKPATLAAPREGAGDDLKRLKGIGPKFEVVLHDLGIYHFDQIAAWGPGEIAWIDANLDGFNGRVERDDWVGQARILAAGGETEHSRLVDRGEPT